MVHDTDKTAQYSVFRDSVLAILCYNQYLVHDIGDTAQYSWFQDFILAIVDNTQYMVHDIGDTAQYSEFGTWYWYNCSKFSISRFGTSCTVQ